jgi:hypothetical protein
MRHNFDDGDFEKLWYRTILTVNYDGPYDLAKVPGVQCGTADS